MKGPAQGECLPCDSCHYTLASLTSQGPYTSDARCWLCHLRKCITCYHGMGVVGTGGPPLEGGQQQVPTLKGHWVFPAASQILLCGWAWGRLLACSVQVLTWAFSRLYLVFR